jgi:hypothetical protein
LTGDEAEFFTLSLLSDLFATKAFNVIVNVIKFMAAADPGILK